MTPTLPVISVVLPTLNSALTLQECLDSIGAQEYPCEKIEVLIADGGSIDATAAIVREFRDRHPGMRVIALNNPLRTGEAGKAVCVRSASGDLLAFIDSDNILEGRDWFRRMVEPFGDEEIIASEPIRYSYRESDGWITRYCALMGMNDPLCYFLGNYDRECALSRTWTRMPYELIEDRGPYLKLGLDPSRLPTMGANGFFIRKESCDRAGSGSYLFDIDILAVLLRDRPLSRVAKVRVGIVHVFTGTLAGFWRKQLRRIADYKQFERQGVRRYRWRPFSGAGLAYFSFSCFVLFPLFFQSWKGWRVRPDRCWLGHTCLCVMTFWAYAIGSLFCRQALDRSAWQTTAGR